MQVDVEHVPVGRQREIDGELRLEDPGAVDEDVERTDRILGDRDELVECVGAGQIPLHSVHRSAEVGNRLEVHSRHDCPLGGEGLDDRPPDAVCAARHERRAPREQTHSAPPASPLRCWWFS